MKRELGDRLKNIESFSSILLDVLLSREFVTHFSLFALGSNISEVDLSQHVINVVPAQ